MRSLTVSFAAFLAGAVTLVPNDARACGGCIYGAPTEADASTSQSPSVVTDHRMALAIDPEMTTLWDQIEYAGEPEQFAWVLPIRGTVVVGLGSDAFIDAIDQRTTPTILGPRVFCNPPPAPPPGSGSNGGSSSDFGSGGRGGSFGCGCGGASDMEAMPTSSGTAADAGSGFASDTSAGPPDEGVTVTERKSVGPYETVQISGDSSESIIGWLRRNKYVIPTDIEPILKKYTDEKFDFLAVRLAPGSGVHAMKPIRVSWRGATPMLPLRMVAAGVGASVGIKLFVIGDGRWKTKNFATYTIEDSDLIWDFRLSRSNYTALRADKAGLQDMHAFALETSDDYAGSLFPTRDADDSDGGLSMSDGAGKEASSEVGDATDDASVMDAIPSDAAPVPPPEDTGMKPLVSPTATDVEVAFGKKSIRRITRLRADLPSRHLNIDLELEADTDQSVIGTRRSISRHTGAETLCTWGVSSVQPQGLDEPPPSIGGKPPTAAACTVGERTSPFRVPPLGVFSLLGLAVARSLLRRRP